MYCVLILKQYIQYNRWKLEYTLLILQFVGHHREPALIGALSRCFFFQKKKKIMFAIDTLYNKWIMVGHNQTRLSRVSSLLLKHI